MMIAVQRCVSPTLPIMLYSPGLTSTLELSSHASNSLVTVPTFKSAGLIRSLTTVDTCIHLGNKTEGFFSLFFFSDMSPQLYSSVDFGRKWQLIHEHVTPNRFYWWVIFFSTSLLFFFFILLHSSAPKFCLLRNAETVARVLRDWATDIDGLEQGVWLTGDAAEILHIFYPLIQSGRD